MTDLDLLFDYYTSVQFAAGGYSVFACRVKDDKLEKTFRDMAISAIKENREASKLVIKLGGDIF